MRIRQEEKEAHLYPAPDGREERRRVYDTDSAERLRVVGGRKRGRLLEVGAELPEELEGDVAEVNDGRAGRDRRRLDAPGKGAAEPVDEASKRLVKRDAGRGKVSVHVRCVVISS